MPHEAIRTKGAIGAIGTCFPAMALPMIIIHAAAVARAAGDVSLRGSTIANVASSFLPDVIYKKFPSDQPVSPNQSWELSFGVQLPGAPPTVEVSLGLDPQNPHPEIQVVQGNATFEPQGGLYHNYASAGRYELIYTGAANPFVGPIDVVLTPDGFAPIHVRVHLNAVDQSGFPAVVQPFVQGTSAVADIIGDNRLEIILGGTSGGQAGVYAFDHAGNLLPGWPLTDDGENLVDQFYSTPALADLDGDGLDEVVVAGYVIRSTAGMNASGNTTTTLLQAAKGDGTILWQIIDSFEESAIAAIADLDGDQVLDIVIGGGHNLKRFDTDATPRSGWQVSTSANIHVEVPVIADVDGDPADGLEIVACAVDFGPPVRVLVYVWNEDGSLLNPAWPKIVERCVPPTVVNLDANLTNGREIVLAVEHDDPPVNPDTGLLNTFTVFAWHADGSDVSGWPHHFMRPSDSGLIDDRVPSGCSAGDVDGDGELEVIVATYGQGAPANGNLFVFHHDGTLDGNWPRWAGTAQTPSSWGGPALADLDGDGRLEIVTGSFLGIYAFYSDGLTYPGFPKYTGDVFGQPMIGDLDGDGAIEVASAALFDRLYIWDLVEPGPVSASWPQFRLNAANTGTLERPPFIPVPTISEVGIALIFVALAASGSIIIRRRPKGPR